MGFRRHIKTNPTGTHPVGSHSVEKPIIIKSALLNISPTPPKTLSVPTKH